MRKAPNINDIRLTHQHSVDQDLLEDAVPGQQAGQDVLGEAELLPLLGLSAEIIIIVMVKRY